MLHTKIINVQLPLLSVVDIINLPHTLFIVHINIYFFFLVLFFGVEGRLPFYDIVWSHTQTTFSIFFPAVFLTAMCAIGNIKP